MLYNGRPYVYVDLVLSKETFLKCYDYQIQSMLGEKMWLKCNYAKIKPPHMKTLTRKPKNRRIRVEGEPNDLKKINKSGIKMKCSKYG